MSNMVDNDFLAEVFPLKRTDEFFEALFGGAEEGAYNIVVVVKDQTDDVVDLAFELHQRPGMCLVCSLTYGLSEVFKRHPIINAKGLAQAVAERKGWSNCSWEIGRTREESRKLHWIPFRVSKA